MKTLLMSLPTQLSLNLKQQCIEVLILYLWVTFLTKSYCNHANTPVFSTFFTALFNKDCSIKYLMPPCLKEQKNFYLSFTNKLASISVSRKIGKCRKSAKSSNQLEMEKKMWMEGMFTSIISTAFDNPTSLGRRCVPYKITNYSTVITDEKLNTNNKPGVCVCLRVCL